MREHLIAFIKAAAAKQDGTNRYDNGGPDAPNRRELFHLSGSSPADGRDTNVLFFGYGYFDGDKTLWYDKDAYPTQLSVEDGVDAFLKAYDLDR